MLCSLPFFKKKYMWNGIDKFINVTTQVRWPLALDKNVEINFRIRDIQDIP